MIPLVSGKFVLIDGVTYLVATTDVKNAGLSKIEFDHAECVLVIFAYTRRLASEIHTVSDERLTSFDVFEGKLVLWNRMRLWCRKR